METGRVIHRRYLLQRLIKQEQGCTLYQGFDQVLQRAVAVKVPHPEHIPAYRAAVRATSQFAHPHIVGIYDLIMEPEHLYIVQEYVDGDAFEDLFQKQLTPTQIIELGIQVCQALLYTTTPSRKICHGNLTPDAIMRDKRGYVRVSNFALPSDVQYFTRWSVLGSEGVVISDPELPAGQMTDGRLADDTRAVGLLLYQLLTAHPAGTTSAEPPADRRMRFSRNVPPELCDLIARTIVRQHPQHITTPIELHTELKQMAEALEPSVPVAVSTPVGAFEARVSQLSPAIPARPSGRLSNPAPTPVRESSTSGILPAAVAEVQPATSGPLGPSLAISGVSAKLAAARQAAYPEPTPQPIASAQRPGVPIAVMLGLGLGLFVLFFVIGFFVAQTLP